MTTSSKSFVIDADTKSFIDYAVGVAMAKTVRAPNHIASVNSASIAVTTAGTILVGATLPSVSSKGKFRVITQAIFSNSAVSTGHTLTPSLQIVAGTAAPVTVFTGAGFTWPEGNGNAQVMFTYEVPATTATLFAGKTVTANLIGAADAATVLSVPALGATIDIAEVS